MKVVILRGISGSGKSSYTKEHYPNAVVCSADHYFIDPSTNEYKFDPSKLAEAHQLCLRKFIRHLAWGPAGLNVDYVVVDNTNTQLWEISPYLSVAQAYECDVEIIRCVCPPHVAAERNAHGVPVTTIEAMARRFENLLSFWPKETVVNTYKE